jgi:hypothetical protein
MTDLTDRMRTCAAYILKAATADERDAGTEFALNMAARDAADLLIEASNVLEIALRDAVLGDPMEIIPPVVVQADASESFIPKSQHGAWIAPGGPLPGVKHSGTISPRACPKCDSRANKTVYRRNKHFVLECPACGHVWERA